MLTAKEAKQITDTVIQTLINNELSEIDQLIKNVCNDGNTTVLTIVNFEETLQELERLGYKLKLKDFHEYWISWKDVE